MRTALLTLAIAAASLVLPQAMAQPVRAPSASAAQSADECRRGPEPVAVPCGNACRSGMRTVAPPAAPMSVAVSCVASAAAVSPAVATASAASAPASAASATDWAASSAEAAAWLRQDEHRLRSSLLYGALSIAGLLAAAAIYLMFQSGARARRDGGLKATSHWGGFGGSGGGWQVAPALASLLAATVLALAAALIVASVLDATRPATSTDHK